jgi:XTP/dITP diphosphohydrolase
MEIIVATSSQHKLLEIRSVLPKSFKIHSLIDIGFVDEIEETGTTFAQNAFIKAKVIFDKTGKNVLADDSGLEVEAINNSPGVYSARYAGLPVNQKKNVEKLLGALHGITNRNAKFKTVLAFIYQGQTNYFEGIIEGSISIAPKGNNGFGYDPVFIPEGYLQTFAELSSKKKNLISHRALALQKFNTFLLKAI